MNEFNKRIMPCPSDHENQLKVIIISMSPSLWQKRFCLRIYLQCPPKSNHYGEGCSVTCQVFFFTRQKTILSLLSGSRPWGTLIYQGMKKYFAKNVEYMYKWQSNCMHPLWGSGDGEREVKDFQWNEEEFPFSEDFLKFRYHPKGFLVCPTQNTLCLF